MSAFDDRYEFRFAAIKDIPAIMEFINCEWKEGHILAVNRLFFEYEFLDGDRVNFILAIEKKDNTLQGIQGFLKMAEETEGKGIWSCMWKVKERGNLPLLGVELSKRVESMTGCAYRIGPGSNPVTAIPIYKAILRKFTAKMRQYYMLNPEAVYKIARIQHLETEGIVLGRGAQLRTLHSIEEVKKVFSFKKYSHVLPYKESWYYDKRFFKHPIYKYQIYGIFEKKKEEAEALLVIREVECNGSRILRIVDFEGNQECLEKSGESIFEIMKQRKCEYVDFYCYGIAEEYLTGAGFVWRTDNDENIIPNYFEPFVQENVDIWFHATGPEVIVCKADGDQDRPSLI